MEKRIAFKNMEHSDVLEKFANEKLEKLEKLLESERSPIYINLVLEQGKVHAHNKVDLNVSTAEFQLFAKREGPDFIVEINSVIDIMVDELRTAKKKLIDERRKKDSFRSA